MLQLILSSYLKTKLIQNSSHKKNDQRKGSSVIFPFENLTFPFRYPSLLMHANHSLLHG